MQTNKTVPVLEMEDLAVGYGSKVVLSGLSHQVAPGQFVCLLGPNGAGKTTLLRTLAGLQPALAGGMRLSGRPYEQMSQAEIGRHLAVVLTERPAIQLMTALELVCLGRYPHTGFLGRLGPEDLHQTRHAMKLVGAWDLSHRPLDQLSDGERQKMMVARALAQEPRLILLDEPTMHLDVKHQMEVMSILQELCRKQGVAVVASLHDVGLAARLADTVALVHEGGIQAWGPPEQILDSPTITGLYGLDRARYLPELGVIEPSFSNSQQSVFVVGGGGTGAMLMRLLAKKGFAIKTGVLHKHDLDFHVATALGAEVAAQAPFTAVSPASLEQAASMAQGCPVVFDSGFPVGSDNQANRNLLLRALEQGLGLVSLRSPQDMEALLGRTPNGCRFAENVAGAVSYLEDQFGAQLPSLDENRSGLMNIGLTR